MGRIKEMAVRFFPLKAPKTIPMTGRLQGFGGK
jgi:hypothetical protein